jgi:hypothetical protein
MTMHLSETRKQPEKPQKSCVGTGFEDQRAEGNNL